MPNLHRVVAAVVLLAAGAAAAEDAAARTGDGEDAERVDELVVEAQRLEGEGDAMGLLPTRPQETAFGLAKSLHETPRAVTSVSETMLESYGIRRVEDFANVTAGAYTASFFGMSGNMDLRGSQADMHFRGMRRLISAGGWVSLIEATHRVDIVRGPASPIHGPGVISGYLNVVPKTARAEEGRLLERTSGEASFSLGSWDRFEADAQVGGPVRLFGKPGGYHVFALVEESGSFYRFHEGDTQRMLQSSLVVDLRDNVWLEVGQQYQRWRGAEVAGWNRIDQTLIDTGMYLAGTPLIDLDTDRDGRISQAEVLALSPANRLTVFTPFGSGIGLFESDAERDALRLDPATVRRVKVSADQCLCSAQDDGAADNMAAYLDIIAELDRVTVRQKLFLDYADRFIEVSYGFSQAHETFAAEERLEVVFDAVRTDGLTANLVVAPAVRYYDTHARQDFLFEYFNRRDITRPPSALDQRVSSWDSPVDNPFNIDVETTALTAGLGLLADVTIADRVSLLGGWRRDRYRIESANGPAVYGPAIPDDRASNTVGESSWSVSASLKLGAWRPYVTVAKQAMPVGGQSGEVAVNNVRTEPLQASSLREAGVKFAGFGGRVRAQLDYYEQRRTDYASQTAEILAVRGVGWEFDLRALVSDRLALLVSATRPRLYREPPAGRFIFAPPAITGFAPEDQYGGILGTVLPANDSRFLERGALPSHVRSIGLGYRHGDRLGVNLTASRVGPAWSGVAQSVRLPSYTLVNASASLDRGPWRVRVSVQNALDELYFQGNFPQIFGDVVTLPQRPRNWRLSVTRRFGQRE